MKTKTEIIEETADYYAEDPPGRRAIGPHGAGQYYSPATGNCCAVGRTFQDAKSVYEKHSNVLMSDGFKLDKFRDAEYRGHDRAFWADLMHLHDHHNYWTDRGLSESGEAYKHQLLEEYKDH